MCVGRVADDGEEEEEEQEGVRCVCGGCYSEKGG